MADLSVVFAELRKTTAPYASGEPPWFGGVRIRNGYVSYDLMPVYVDPALVETVTPDLKKRMQGSAAWLRRVAAAVVVAAVTACSATTGMRDDATPRPHAVSSGSSDSAAVAEAAGPAAGADDASGAYSPADVEFMTDMIHHHAQALVMARMAPTHGASPSVRLLAERIINGQKDEIASMARWLRDRNEPVPDVASEVADSGAPAADGVPEEPSAAHAAHPMHMPGMLSAEQLEKLDAARGMEFDRLFLTYMIQHHRGALEMVDTLFSSPGAAREETMFRIASGIGADQAAEIDRMQSMLRDLLFDTGGGR